MTQHLGDKMKKLPLMVPAHLNPHTMTKKELIDYTTKYCKHGHRYSEHPNCFIEEQGRDLKIGYFDIETTGFEANYHCILTYCIKTRDKKEYYEGQITREDMLSGQFDKKVVQQLAKDMLKYDILIGYYSTKFDVPFIRSRALKNGVDFPVFGAVKHKDLYYMVKRLLKLHRNTLDAATNFLGIKGKNHVLGDIWMKARLGDTKSLRYVAKHNRLDCQITEKLHKKLEMYDKGLAKSI